MTDSVPHAWKSTTHNEKFMHIPLDDDRFAHATVFARDEGNDNAGHHWFMAIAWHNHHDQFVKRIGRQVARRHYFAAESGGSRFTNGRLIQLGDTFDTEVIIGVVMVELSKLRERE